MRKNVLCKTNILVCLILLAGFLSTTILGYRANYSASLQNIEQISVLSSDGIYYQIANIFLKPINVSLTMANDYLLKDFLLQEADRLEDPDFIETMRCYLAAYREQYGYDAVFLTSEASGRYYNFGGLDRVLSPEEPEDQWYFDRIYTAGDYYVVVDNDQVAGADNSITAFVNAPIRDRDGQLLGAVGVGLRVVHLQQLLCDYQEQFGITAFLVDQDGEIEVSAEHTGYESVRLADTGHFDGQTLDAVLSGREAEIPRGFWVPNDHGGAYSRYVVTRFLPELDWHLVVDQDTSGLIRELNNQLAVTVAVIAVIILVILLIITLLINSFNQRIIHLTRTMERERQDLFQSATEQLFENIYELDITHNCPANAATEAYFQRLGIPPGTAFDDTLRLIAEKQVKEEFRQGYVDTFSTGSVQRAFDQGKDTLYYEFMITQDGQHYYWMRITARLVRLESERSLHMFVYRQNIDAEKQREHRMWELAEMDEMTGLLSKTATQRRVEQLLQAGGQARYAYFIFDIDNFKQANDQFGHAFGDTVICAFAEIIRQQFAPGSILGRVGGDEFAAFTPIPDRDWAEQKAAALVQALHRAHTWDGMCWKMSVSIGVAFAPECGADAETIYQRADAALYEVKHREKGGYALCAGEK